MKQKRMDGAYTHARNTEMIICRLSCNCVVFGSDEGLHGRVRWATLYSENIMNGETGIKVSLYLNTRSPR